MKLTNKTEEEYKEVALRLEAIEARAPAGVVIMSNIVGICNDIALGASPKEIVNLFQIPLNEKAFTAAFKKANGV